MNQMPDRSNNPVPGKTQPPNANTAQIHVAAAVIVNDKDEVLISLRHPHAHQGGLWEFPGGKVEANENVRSALDRELNEELGITVQRARPLIRIHHQYPDKSVLLDVFEVSQFAGEAQGREGQPCRWVKRSALEDYPFPAANLPIIRAANLPSYYLITPEPAGAHADFLQSLEVSLQSGIKLVQLRAKTLDENRFRQLATELVELCRYHDATLLLNASEEVVASIAGACGIHMTSDRLMHCNRRPFGKEKLVAASCHSVQQLQQAQNIGADFAVLAPVQKTLSHADAEPLGWQAFQTICDEIAIPVYALGGLGPDQLDQAHACGAQGIAAIGSLWGKELGEEQYK